MYGSYADGGLQQEHSKGKVSAADYTQLNLRLQDMEEFSNGEGFQNQRHSRRTSSSSVKSVNTNIRCPSAATAHVQAGQLDASCLAAPMSPCTGTGSTNTIYSLHFCNLISFEQTGVPVMT
jgi:hypothetical protein